MQVASRWTARWLGLVVWVWAEAAAAAGGRELLRDPAFARGFAVLAPTPGKQVIVREVRFDPDAGEPVWRLAQWNSRFSLETAPLLRTSQGGWALTNRAKTVIVEAPGRPEAELTLGVDSRPEYDRYRQPGEPWPHLLVSQSIPDCPPLDTLEAMPLHLKARVTQNEVFRGEGYREDLHAAQCPLVLIVRNFNRQSPGYGDFFWFSVPLFDDRWEFPPRHVARDTADPSAKLIYNPGLRAFTDQTLMDGDWVDLTVDLLPHLREGLRTGWDLGCLQGSRDVGDYRIASFILGWEVPGINRAEIRFRELSLQAVPAAPQPGYPAFDFTDPEQSAQWTPNQDIASAVTTADGLELTLAGHDPYLVGPPADYPPGQPLRLRLELFSETAGPWQIFHYRTTPGEANSVRFVAPAGQWVTARVPVPPLGRGHRLRIDPPGTQVVVRLPALDAARFHRLRPRP
ncbi:MAG: hypothetical protein D6766_09750 [Verrucomicrobia bacterium]|nr:MAG: hypothetical protein D6766_09750 [Verrucomicrobiota bacterium]